MSTIDNCIIEYCETCVSCTTYKANITNNEIRFFKYVGINGKISEFLIRNNRVHDYKGDLNHGIHIYNNSNGIIECNVVYDGDGYGIRVGGSFSAINNTVHDIRYSEKGHGIAITGGAYERPIIKNNLIYNCNNGIKIWNDSNPQHGRRLNKEMILRLADLKDEINRLGSKKRKLKWNKKEVITYFDTIC